MEEDIPLHSHLPRSSDRALLVDIPTILVMISKDPVCRY